MQTKERLNPATDVCSGRPGSGECGMLMIASVRHEVACAEWSRSSQPSVQGCLQSLSASLVTGRWKARDNVQGSV